MRALHVALALVAALPLKGAAAPSRVAPLRAERSPTGPGPSGRVEEPVTAVDREVERHLRRRGLALAPIAADSVFLRRVSLDLAGTLPAIADTRAFLADTSPGRRAALVDRLLASDEFADYWAMKWSDALRVKSEYPINLWPNAVQAYHRWIRTSVRDNVPFDQFVHALLTASGSNVRVPPVNFYRAVQNRAPAGLAQAVALTFLGMRSERWSEERQGGFAAFFSRVGYKSTSEWKEEVVFFDRAKTASALAVLPDGTKVALPADRDPRLVFADWLRTSGRPWLARALANRLWFWLLGHGIVHEPDDLRPDNPPAEAALLDLLARELEASGFDVRHAIRLIVSSRTYQQATDAAETTSAARPAFATYQIRLLDAEVLADALCQITGLPEHYTSAIPEPFTFTPMGQRAIALADGSISSTLLDTFGRSPRDTGLLLERQRAPTTAERLYLLNSSHIQTKIAAGPALQPFARPARPLQQAVSDLYLTILTRPPSEREVRSALAHAAAAPDRRAAVSDVVWALVNSVEFLYRH